MGNILWSCRFQLYRLFKRKTFKIWLSDSSYLLIQYPKRELFKDIFFRFDNDLNVIVEIIAKCIICVHDDSTIYNFKNYPYSEIVSFVNKLPLNKINMILDTFNKDIT